MDHYKSVVMDYLQSDRAVFVNAECRIPIDAGKIPEKSRQHCSCDAVAIDLRHGAVYLCETASEDERPSLLKKLSTWTKNWDLVKTALERDCMVPANWRIHVWLFVPKDSIEVLDEKLELLRQNIGSKFKVKVTALEDVQTWRFSTWERREAEWERKGRRTLN